MIVRSCRNALNLINDLLDITALDRIDYQLETQTTELNEFLDGIVKTNQAIANGKDIKIVFTKTNAESLYASVNIPKFSRVINNLITNAIKFSNRGSTIDIATGFKANKAFIQVKDYGIGIPQDMQSIIFDRFTKAGRKGTEGEKSMGLGMSIVKRIVDLHHGTITLESKEGEGTLINIELSATKQKPTQISNA
jgi:signal transduction histidine kinase